ncbi:MAG: hypothetical protein JNK87_12380 [Bryobacterales bacterium]|nr:hypothetical protein [Bryobacterales bacterium]
MFEVRPKGAGRVVTLCLLGALAVVCGAAWSLPIWPLLTAASIAVFVSTLRARVVFYEDRLCCHLFGTQTVRREDVVGWRIDAGEVFLALRDTRQEPLRVPWGAGNDPRVRAWLGDLPEGVSEREDDSILLNTVGFEIMNGIVAFWFVITGHWSVAMMLVAAPFAAWMMSKWTGAKPILGVLLVAPILLSIKTMCVTAVEPLLAFTLAAGGCCVYCVLLAKLVGLPAAPSPVLIALGLLFGYGAGMQLNTQFDMAKPVVYKSQVLRKYVSGGRRQARMVRLGPWGQRGSGWAAEIRPERWEALQPGDQVCVQSRAGTLGVEWFDEWQIAACR